VLIAVTFKFTAILHDLLYQLDAEIVADPGAGTFGVEKPKEMDSEDPQLKLVRGIPISLAMSRAEIGPEEGSAIARVRAGWRKR
jgi:hypothetical protein